MIDLGIVIALMRSAVIEIMFIAGPVLLVAMGIGLIISIFQATTSIQDQTLTFVPKIIAILVTIGVLGGWMITRMVGFTVRIFQTLNSLGG